MDRNVIITILVIAIIIVGIVLWQNNVVPQGASQDLAPTGEATTAIQPAVSDTKSSAPKSATVASKNPTTKSGVSGKILKYDTVASALASGKSMKCVTSTGPVSTNYYIANGNTRREDITSMGTMYFVATQSSTFSWYKGSTQETDYTGGVASIERNKLFNTSLVNIPCTSVTISSSLFARP